MTNDRGIWKNSAQESLVTLSDCENAARSEISFEGWFSIPPCHQTWFIYCNRIALCFLGFCSRKVNWRVVTSNICTLPKLTMKAWRLMSFMITIYNDNIIDKIGRPEVGRSWRSVLHNQHLCGPIIIQNKKFQKLPRNNFKAMLWQIFLLTQRNKEIVRWQTNRSK